jgi:hypothetical protein
MKINLLLSPKKARMIYYSGARRTCKFNSSRNSIHLNPGVSSASGEARRVKTASQKFRRRNEKTLFGISGGSSFICWCC